MTIERSIWLERSASRAIVAAALLSLTTPCKGAAQQFTYDGGIQFAAGGYGFTRTVSSLVFANGVTVEGGRWRVSGSLPFIIQDGRGVLYSGAGAVPTGGMGMRASPGMGSGGMGTGGMTPSGSSAPTANNAGFGDPLLRGDVAIAQRGGAAQLRLVGAVKAPFAGTPSGYGTGRWDLGTGVSAAVTAGATFIFAVATYWAIGKPDSIPVQNIVVYSLAAGRPLARQGRIGVLLSLVGASPLIRGLAAPLSAGLGVSYRMTSRRIVSAMVSAGLSPTAPAATVGVGWRLPIS